MQFTLPKKIKTNKDIEKYFKYLTEHEKTKDM